MVPMITEADQCDRPFLIYRETGNATKTNRTFGSFKSPCDFCALYGKPDVPLDVTYPLRHFYEIIREGKPLKMFFVMKWEDLLCIETVESISKIFAVLYATVSECLASTFNVPLLNVDDFCVLDSTCTVNGFKNYSYHVVVTRGAIFENIKVLSDFVRQKLLYALFQKIDLHRNTNSVILPSVYTKNRQLLLCGSSPCGSDHSASLRICSTTAIAAA